MSEFVEFLSEVFGEFGQINSRKMFGGYGIYHNGVMFGLVAEDTLYLKADKTTQKIFESRGLRPFEYDKGDRIVKMSYYSAPDEIFDDREEAAKWARMAYKGACQSKTGKR